MTNEENRHPALEREEVLKARAYAIMMHGDQTYDDEPYVVHLDAVAEILVEFGYDDTDLLVAAYLHDVIEDTEATHVDVAARFGERAAALVYAVTSEEGHPNRKTRNAATYANRTVKEPGAVTLKAADRLANVRRGGRLVGLYRKEQPAFVAALRGSGEAEPMFAALDSDLM